MKYASVALTVVTGSSTNLDSVGKEYNVANKKKDKEEKADDAEVVGEEVVNAPPRNLVVMGSAAALTSGQLTDPDMIRNRIKHLRLTIDECNFEMAELLYKVWDVGENGKPLYLGWGYQTWNEYVEKELEFSIRKAQYMVSIWDWFGVQMADAPGLMEKVRPLGWTRVKELVGVINQKNAEEWIEKCKTLSAQQLSDEARAFIKARKAAEEQAALNGSSTEANDKPPEKLHTLSFRLYDAQLETVQAALQRAKDFSQSDKNGNNMELICQDWLATNDAMKGDKKKNVRAYMHKFESLLGIRIIAIDIQKKEILCGGDVVQGMSALEDKGEAAEEVVT